MNRRKEIKKYLYSLFSLELGEEVRIYDTRRTPFQEAELPFLLYYIANEESEISSEATQETKKKADLCVEVVFGDEPDVMGLLDDLSARIENKFTRDRFLGDLVSSITLKSTEAGMNPEGEEILGLIRMHFELIYFAKPDDPSEYLRVTDFKKKVIHWRSHVHSI